MDGLELYAYSQANVRFKPEIMEFIRTLEILGRELAEDGLSSYDYVTKKSEAAVNFLRSLEMFLRETSEDKWDYVLFQGLSQPTDIATCFWLFQNTPDRLSSLQSLQPLVASKGDSLMIGQLRSITAVARLLQPDRWAALSWRVLSCVGFESITHLRGARIVHSRQKMAAKLQLVYLDQILGAYAFMEKQVSPALPHVAQVAMALYNLSLSLWPVDLPFERQD